MIHARRKSLTMRFDPDLLVAARRCAAEENRTLTNFIETVVRREVLAATSTAAETVAAETTAAPKARQG
jgi:hypothetical protein